MKGIERRNGETDFAYKYRLIMGKATKVEPYYSLEWQDIVELLGIDQHRDTLRKRGDSWKELIEHADEIGLKDSDNETLYEIKKEKILLSDMKKYVNKKTRELARWEDMINDFKDSIELDNGVEYIQPNVKEHEVTGRDCILCISDIHYGLEVDNNVNVYNPNVAVERLNDLIDKTINRCKMLPIDKLHVVILGDTISGLIHNTLRYESRLDVADQMIQISNILVQCIKKLAKNPYIPFVTVTSVNGNHDRLYARKDECLPQDNFTKVINNNLRKDLSKIDKVVYLDNTINHEEIAILDVKGKTVVAVHGDKVSKNDCKKQLEGILETDIDIILMGHYHRPSSEAPIYNTRVFVNGSVIGSDSYAIQKKLYTKPSQKLIFIDDLGIGDYDIEL